MMQGMEGLSRVRVTEQRFVLDDEALRDLRDLGDRLAGARVGLDLGSGWGRGVPSGWLRALLEAWRDFATYAVPLRFEPAPARRRGRARHWDPAERKKTDASPAQTAATGCRGYALRFRSGANSHSADTSG